MWCDVIWCYTDVMWCDVIWYIISLYKFWISLMIVLEDRRTWNYWYRGRSLIMTVSINVPFSLFSYLFWLPLSSLNLIPPFFYLASLIFLFVLHYHFSECEEERSSRSSPIQEEKCEFHSDCTRQILDRRGHEGKLVMGSDKIADRLWNSFL